MIEKRENSEKKPAESVAVDTPPGAADSKGKSAKKPAKTPKEIGGPEGPEPTRFGDWERKGRCIDF